MNRYIDLAKGFMRFIGLAAALVVFLIVLNWLPQAVDKGGMRPYPGIQELRKEAGFGSVLVPSYFPEGIKWPPSLVLGQKSPFMAAVMEFDGDEVQRALVISESVSADFEPGHAARFSQLRQSVEMDLRGRKALIETGLCSDGAACSRLSWQEGSMHVRLFMRAPTLTLIRIAESMLQ
jgi:hypothetical protein